VRSFHKVSKIGLQLQPKENWTMSRHRKNGKDTSKPISIPVCANELLEKAKNHCEENGFVDPTAVFISPRNNITTIHKRTYPVESNSSWQSRINRELVLTKASIYFLASDGVLPQYLQQQCAEPDAKDLEVVTVQAFRDGRNVLTVMAPFRRTANGIEWPKLSLNTEQNERLPAPEDTMAPTVESVKPNTAPNRDNTAPYSIARRLLQYIRFIFKALNNRIRGNNWFTFPHFP